MTFVQTIPLHGKGVALLSAGGGISVAGADALSREGLAVPTLAETTQRSLRQYVPEAGSSIRNPLDAGIALRELSYIKTTLDAIAADPGIDCIILNLALDLMGPSDNDIRRRPEIYAEYLGHFAKENSFGKPLAAIVRSPGFDSEVEKQRYELQSLLIEAGVAVFPSLPRAAIALGKFARYHEFLKEQE